MKLLCVIEKDGRVVLPELITQKLNLSKGNYIELEFDDHQIDLLYGRNINEFDDHGVPIPYEALEAACLMDENNLGILVLDRAVIVTTHDKILEMFIEEAEEYE